MDQKPCTSNDENKLTDKNVQIANNSATFSSSKKEAQANQLKYINS